jgi:hypothetical protein
MNNCPNNNCSSSNNNVNNNVYRCYSCNNKTCSNCNNEINQRRIWNTVRVPSSLYRMNLATLNVTGDINNKPKTIYGNVNWNQMSDRAVPSITKNKSGSIGVGVDIKYNSYARYLARRKGKNIKTNKTHIEQPKYGNKEFPYGIIKGCNC